MRQGTGMSICPQDGQKTGHAREDVPLAPRYNLPRTSCRAPRRPQGGCWLADGRGPYLSLRIACDDQARMIGQTGLAARKQKRLPPILSAVKGENERARELEQLSGHLRVARAWAGTRARAGKLAWAWAWGVGMDGVGGVDGWALAAGPRPKTTCAENS